MARFFKNNFSDVLLTPEDSRVTAEGLSLDVRLPWYRSLPLSVVMPSELLVDGQRVPLDGATVEHEGRRYTLAELPEQVAAWWFVQDSIKLLVPMDQPLSAAPHEVTLTLHLFPPYIPMLTWVTRGNAVLQGVRNHG
ncbi:DUF6379 domain-containing protein [Pelomonas sp. KK5]|uniref:C-glycoside deglycosidase beta subunit domain-containing protein n=1 Tax=Pelomonas sp. KK5 TaxID=1855730 RepID=UPI0009F8DAF3|nr:DUF6379 domain-containing protein [Pelomonas sp. KK5]